MNITQLNFSDEELSTLVNSYIKVLILAISIDWKINKKEVKVLLSLLTKVNIDSDNIKLKEFNIFNENRHFKNNLLNLENDFFEYIRIFAIENIIFFEWEKAIHLILSSLSKKEKLTFEEKIKKLEIYLENIKKIIESKKELLWEDEIKIFYYSLYFYCEVIAKQVWNFLWKKIVKEEKVLLEKIRLILNVENDIKQSCIERARKVILEI